MKNDSNAGTASVPDAWIAVDHGLGTDRRLAPYTLVLKGDRSLYQAIAEDDWALVLNPAGEIVRAGRVLRLRSDLETTTIFFDRLSVAEIPVPVASISLAPPSSGNVGPASSGSSMEPAPTHGETRVARLGERACRYSSLAVGRIASCIAKPSKWCKGK